MADGVLRKVEVSKIEIPFMVVKEDNLIELARFIYPRSLILDNTDNIIRIFIKDLENEDVEPIQVKFGDIVSVNDWFTGGYIRIFDPDESDFIPVYNEELLSEHDEEYYEYYFRISKERPYDSNVTGEVDTEHKIARAVLADLRGRLGVGNALADVTPATRVGIVKDIATIIKLGLKKEYEGTL